MRFCATIREISAMPLPGNNRQLSPEKALLRLETRCARSEVCEREALDKMRGWGLSSQESAEVLESLKRRKFIDNARYASAFVRDKYRFQRWGRRKIAYALALKGISKPVIASAMEEIDPEEYTRILEGLIRARARVLGEEAATYEGRTKLFRMAASRGYESGAISAVIRGIPETGVSE